MEKAAVERIGSVVLACASALVALGRPASAQVTSRISLAPSGAEGDSDSYSPSLSAGGRYVAFSSLASNLVAGDTFVSFDVFVRDRVSGLTERVSVSSSGVPASGGVYTSNPTSINADGRYVAFESSATNLVGGDTNGVVDVFVHDRVSGLTERVSVDSSGAQGNGASDFPSISADGRYVAFQSSATNLVAGDTNGLGDVFVHDRVSGLTERVSVTSSGTQANGVCSLPAISADGRYVAFNGGANNLVAGDTNGAGDVFVHDRVSGLTERVNITSSGGEAIGANGSGLASISADGRCVSFMSIAANLVAGDTNATFDVFVHDRVSGLTERVSVDSSGVQGNFDSTWSSMSADGRYVAFMSHATNLVVGDTNNSQDVFVRDRVSQRTERVSVNSSGAQVTGDTYVPVISSDGRYVAFPSDATNLVAGDTNDASDVFVRDRLPMFTAFCFGDGLDVSHSTPCPCANTGTAGNGCASSVNAGGARLVATGTTYADDVRLVASGMSTTTSCIFLQGDALDDATFGDGVRCAGGDLVRLRARSTVAGTSTFPNSTDTVTLSARGRVAPFSGSRRYYQTYYLDASATFCPPATFNVTNAVIVDW